MKTISIRLPKHKRANIAAHIFGCWSAHPLYQPRSGSLLWTVTHVPTGRCLHADGIPKVIALEVAKTLGREINLKTERAIRGRAAHVREIWSRCGADVGRTLRMSS